MNSNMNFQVYTFYSLLRYFLIEFEYSHNFEIKKHDITLPQLRVLMIIKVFPGISQEGISSIGYWSPPTVSNIMKLLFQKELIYREDSDNKKAYKMKLTEKGEEVIGSAKQGRDSGFAYMKLLNKIDEKNLKMLQEILINMLGNEKSDQIIEYVEKINLHRLIFKYDEFSNQEGDYLKGICLTYNLLRIFNYEIEKIYLGLLYEYKITLPQLIALNILKSYPGINSTELGELGYWPKSTVSVIVKHLSEKNLIQKEKGNIKNTIHLHISNEGKYLLSKTFNIVMSNIEGLISLKENIYEELVDANKILFQMNHLVGNDKMKDFILKTYISA